MTPDLFTTAAERRRERQLEKQIMELRLLLSKALVVMRDQTGIQAALVKRSIKDELGKVA